MTFLEIYLLVHVMCSIVCIGFTTAKADSGFVETDYTFWGVYIFLGVFLSPIMILMILGVRLHDK